jgi:RNA polymerase sigma-70 factor (ECF subfamily)
MSSGKPADGELYRSFLDGDTTAYDQLMIRYGDSLTIFLFGYLHDWQDAEDLMIDAFVWVMVKRPAIRDGAFKAYLFRTARSLTSSFLRKKRRRIVFSIDGLEKEIAENILTFGASDDKGGTAVSSSVEDDLQTEERKQILHLCLERIEPELREALWLVYMEGMSYAQAAGVIGVRVKRIDRLLTRGKQQMRKELKKEGVTNAYE